MGSTAAAVRSAMSILRDTGRRVMEKQPITALLTRMASGDRAAEERLAEAVVERLEQIAGREMARHNRGHLDGLTLEPRVLAHDALLKILQGPVEFENRRHPLRLRNQGDHPGHDRLPAATPGAATRRRLSAGDHVRAGIPARSRGDRAVPGDSGRARAARAAARRSRPPARLLGRHHRPDRPGARCLDPDRRTRLAVRAPVVGEASRLGR
jgi:hypothetical protein